MVHQQRKLMYCVAVNRRISEIASPITIIGGSFLHGSQEHDYYAKVLTGVYTTQSMFNWLDGVGSSGNGD